MTEKAPRNDPGKNLEQGRRVAALRNRLRKTQEEMAFDLHVSTRTVANWESGDSRRIRHKALLALADYLQTTPEYIETGRHAPPIPDPGEPVDELLDRFSRQQEILRRVAARELLTAEQLVLIEQLLDELDVDPRPREAPTQRGGEEQAA